MKKQLLNIVDALLRYKRHIKYSHHFKMMMKRQHIPNKTAPGEKDYVDYWKRLYPHVETYSYRFYRHYCGDVRTILPEDIGHSIIEAKLNPIRFTTFYEDKNMLPFILPETAAPRSILCRINGSEILDGKREKCSINYNSEPSAIFAILKGEKVILKPSIDTCSGIGVMVFVPENNRYISHDGKCVLDGKFLYQFGDNWVLQESVPQHALFNHFCSSSVNTMRINTYRSVVDEEVHILSAAIRIGREGAIVDNLHQGGGFVGIDAKTGELKHVVLDQYGNKTNILNGIDFSTENFVIPNWDKVQKFCKDVTKSNPHCRLIALDVTVRDNGEPVLIEWNVTPYSCAFWLPMMMGVTPFGDKTEEIVNYCLNKK